MYLMYKFLCPNSDRKLARARKISGPKHLYYFFIFKETCRDFSNFFAQSGNDQHFSKECPLRNRKFDFYVAMHG